MPPSNWSRTAISDAIINSAKDVGFIVEAQTVEVVGLCSGCQGRLMSNALIRLEQVGVTFAGQSVLDNIELSVEPGQIVTLIGPNGAGKTTLVRAVLGLLEAGQRQRLAQAEAARRLHAAKTPRRPDAAAVGAALLAPGARRGSRARAGRRSRKSAPNR